MLEGMAPAQARAVRAAAGRAAAVLPGRRRRRLRRPRSRTSRAGSTRTPRPRTSCARCSRSRPARRRGTPSAPVRGARSRRARRSRPRRAATQDRRTERRTFDPDAPFANEPDTDFTLRRQPRVDRAPSRATRRCPRAAAAHRRTPTASTRSSRARAPPRRAAGPRRRRPTERRTLLCRAAEVMAARRGRTIAVMAHETGKTVREGDPEVSEAIDMASWAAAQTAPARRAGARRRRCDAARRRARRRAVELPVRDPGQRRVRRARGRQRRAAQAGARSRRDRGRARRRAPRGGHPARRRAARALSRRRRRPPPRHARRRSTPSCSPARTTPRRCSSTGSRSCGLIAETSGKNALVITGGADLDLAIRDLVRSAFGHAGQKCSAASLAIVEARLYDDARFLARLADAVRSIRVGPATDLATMMGPVIVPPGEQAAPRAHRSSTPGERWLVEPRPLDDDGRLWTPGRADRRAARLVVPPHRVLRAGARRDARRRPRRRARAPERAPSSGSPAGCTASTPTRSTHWIERVEVGNVYVNRHTTGAIVRRQPFGGWKHSSVGPGAKTGGPDDILRFVRFTPRRRRRRRASTRRCSQPRDLDRDCAPRQNVLRYRPLAHGRRARGAATTPRSSRSSSRPRTSPASRTRSSPPTNPTTRSPRRIAATGAHRLRALGPSPTCSPRACHRAGDHRRRHRGHRRRRASSSRVDPRAVDLAHAAPPRRAVSR